MFIYKFNILTSVFVLMLISFILNNVFILNFLKIYVKCINLYLTETKITSYYLMHFLHTLCNLLSVL